MQPYFYPQHLRHRVITLDLPLRPPLKPKPGILVITTSFPPTDYPSLARWLTRRHRHRRTTLPPTPLRQRLTLRLRL